MFHDNIYGTDTSFMPEFDPCDKFNLTTEAELVCENATNKECMYDYCVTRNQMLAEDTLLKDQTFRAEQLVRCMYKTL